MVRTTIFCAVILAAGVLVGPVQAQKGGVRVGGGGGPRFNGPAPRPNNFQPGPRPQQNFQANPGGPRFIWVPRTTYRTNNDTANSSGGNVWPFLILGFFGVCLVTGIICLIVYFCSANSANNRRYGQRRFADNPA